MAFLARIGIRIPQSSRCHVRTFLTSGTLRVKNTSSWDADHIFPTKFQKFLLVWGKIYPTMGSVPEVIGPNEIYDAVDVIKIKFAIYVMFTAGAGAYFSHQQAKWDIAHGKRGYLQGSQEEYDQNNRFKYLVEEDKKQEIMLQNILKDCEEKEGVVLKSSKLTMV